MKGIQDVRQENLRRLIAETFGGSQTRLAKKLKLEQPGFISRLLSTNPNTRKNIGANLARKIEQAGEKPKFWLDTPHAAEESASYGYSSGTTIKKVPLLDWQEAREGMPRDADLSKRTLYPCPVECGPRTFALIVRGNAMQNPNGRPSFSEGELIFVDPDVAPSPGRHVVANVPKYPDPVFRSIIQDGGRQLLRPLNPSWQEPSIELDATVKIVGVVVFKGEIV